MSMSHEGGARFPGDSGVLTELLPGVSINLPEGIIEFQGHETSFTFRKVPNTVLSEFSLGTGLSLLVADFEGYRKLYGIAWKLSNGWQAVLQPSTKPGANKTRLEVRFEPEDINGATFGFGVNGNQLYFSARDFMQTRKELLFSGRLIVNPDTLGVSVDTIPARHSPRVSNMNQKDGETSFLLRRQDFLGASSLPKYLPIRLMKEKEGMSFSLTWPEKESQITMRFNPDLMMRDNAVCLALTDPEQMKSLVQISSV